MEKKVKSDYRVAIKEFEASYKLLGISVTPKVHAVLDHIEDFFVRQNDGLGLGHHSEQASEAVHKDFTKLWTGAGYKREMINKEYLTISLSVLLFTIPRTNKHFFDSYVLNCEESKDLTFRGLNVLILNRF